MVNQYDLRVQKKPLRAFVLFIFQRVLIFLSIYWVSAPEYFQGYFYYHVDVDLVYPLTQQ